MLVVVQKRNEDDFLAPFFARAQRGELATAGQIKQAFERRVGQEVAQSTISRLLARHGWRKLMPRPKHPNASPEAQEQFKKTLRGRCKRLWPAAQQKITARSCR